MNIDFFNISPSCFGRFKLIKATGIAKLWSQHGEEFISQFIQCRCGESLLNVYASSGNGMVLAPVEIICPSCGLKEQVFHPEKYGWDAQIGECCSMVGNQPLALINDAPTQVVAEYSFQGLENYQDLIADGVKNPQDYFDVFALYTVNHKGQMKEVISYECA